MSGPGMSEPVVFRGLREGAAYGYASSAGNIKEAR